MDDVKKEGDKSGGAILDKDSEIGGVDSLKLEDGPELVTGSDGLNEVPEVIVEESGKSEDTAKGEKTKEAESKLVTAESGIKPEDELAKDLVGNGTETPK